MHKNILAIGIIILFILSALAPITFGAATVTNNETIQPPSAPIIDGPIHGYAGVPYTYTFNSTDPEGHDVWYYIGWGDESPPVEWDGPHLSGEEIPMTHTFSKQGTYTIIAQAHSKGGQSDLGTLEVTMHRNRALINSLFLWFLERFPLLERLLTI